MSNIVLLDCITRLDIPVDRVLDKAKAAGLSQVIVVGEDESGEFYFASSKASGPEALWTLETAKLRLLKIVNNEPEPA